MRNLLSNAASASFVSDDVIKLFVEWIRDYSELHFAVIGAIYNDAGIARARIWQKVGRAIVREDSADADLFRLIIHDLSTGRIVRRHRETDYAGNFIAKQQRQGPTLPTGTQRTMKWAFDDEEEYDRAWSAVVHYAMTDVPPKIEFKKPEPGPKNAGGRSMTTKTHVLSISDWLVLPEVKVPTIRNDSEMGAVVQVAKLGFLFATDADCKKAGISAERAPNGKLALPTALVQEASGPSLHGLPPTLAPWVLDAVALAHAGRNQFPAKVEFGRLNGRVYAEFVIAANNR